MRKAVLSLVLPSLVPALSFAVIPAFAPERAPAQGASQGSPAIEAPFIQGVIADQLDAFNDRDVDAAWDHASPLIQGLFGTPQNFGAMVERGYPMVWTNRNARFLDLRDEGGALRQRVMIADAAGRLWVLDYEMVETPEGWHINGVQVLPAPEVGV